MKKPHVSRTAQLEEKFDNLLSLLKAGAQSDAIAHLSSTGPDDKTSPNSQSEGRSVPSVLDGSLSESPVLVPRMTDSESTLSNSPGSVLHDSVEPSSIEAEQYLTIFRAHKAKYFPFVYVPPTTTAKQLRQTRPFLWLCIMAIASKSTSQQQVLGSEIRRLLAQEMLLKSGQTIDLLLGLLAYIGWYGDSES